jgi:hypothetical protein
MIGDFFALQDDCRVRLTPNAANPIHNAPVMATYSGGYFYCDGTDPMEGPDYYVGDVLTYNDNIEIVP